MVSKTRKKEKMKHIVILSFILLLFGCNSIVNEQNSAVYYNTNDISKAENSMYRSFSLDTIVISDIETSYVGQFSVFNDTLYFADERFAYVFRFDSNGKLISKGVGKGKGPNEITGLSGFVVSKNDVISFNDSNGSIDIFDKNLQKQESFRKDWQINRSYDEVFNNPRADKGDCYEFDYGYPNILKKWDENHVAFIITASHPKFNGYFDSDLYYNYARTFALVDIHSGKVVKLIGRRSPVYLSLKNIPNFDHLNYDTYEDVDEVYLNFWADTDIYLYGKKEDRIKGKFGKAGRDMKIDYRRTNSYEVAENNLSEDRERYGAYTFLKYFPKQNLVMRGYRKGENATTDGLQIYKDYQLVADLDVPQGLQIIGETQGNAFYATIPQDVDQDYLCVFKIKFQ